MPHRVVVLASGASFFVAGIAILPIQLALLEWFRKSELSCDRAGLLATQDPAVAFRVHMKLASGGHLDKFIGDGVMALFGIDGPIWFNHRGLALASNIVAYIWKWMPFWTVIFLASRMAIPQEIYEAADIDGASSSSRFVHVIFPLLGNLYLVCTLLSTLWTIGDFITVYLVSGGAPSMAMTALPCSLWPVTMRRTWPLVVS